MGLLSRKSRTDGVSDPAKLLITEHQKVERLFEQLDSAGSPVERQGLVAQIDAELAAHTAKEEAILYPFIAKHVAKGGPMVGHANHEHGLAKQALGDLVSMDAGDDGLLAVAGRLRTLVEGHVKEEEKAIFPALAKSASNEQLAALRSELEAAKFATIERPLEGEAPATDDARDAAATLASSDVSRPAKKAAAKALAATRSSSKEAPAKKAAAKKAAAKKAAAKKAAAKKAPAKKAAAKKTAAKKTAAKKAPARKAPAKRR